LTYSSDERRVLIDELITVYGLKDYEIYLIDLFPLIEMIWSDGKNQSSEISFAYEFCLHRVAELEKQSNGNSPLTIEHANAFLQKYLETKPDPKLLATLRSYVKPLLLSNSDPIINDQRKQKILNYCLDIAAAAVYSYPYDKHDRFAIEEKKLLKDLFNSF
jgi:hypothetical protein